MLCSTHIIICKKGHVIMFDVKKPEMINKTFRLPLSLVQTLQKVAQAKGVSLNYLIIQCCEFALANLSNNGEDKN